MEKARGSPLGDSWLTISDKDRVRVLTAVAELEAKLLNIELPVNGNVFHEKDLPKTTARVKYKH